MKKFLQTRFLKSTPKKLSMKQGLLLSLLILTFSSVTAQEKPIRVFVLAGQSNAVGYNHIREYKLGKAKFPEHLQKQEDILFWDTGKLASSVQNKWSQLTVSAKGSFGPEISFAYTMAKLMPKYRIAIIKCAFGGTGIAPSSRYKDFIPQLKNFDDKGKNWLPSPQGDKEGLLYQDLIANLRAAEKSSLLKNNKWRYAGLLWMQGEHEAGCSPSMAKDYGKLLKSLITSVRKELKSKKIPTVVGEINNHSWKFQDIARAGQKATCEELKNVSLVKTTDLPRGLSGGAAHFTCDGTLSLGLRFAKAMAKYYRLKFPENINFTSVANPQKDDILCLKN